VPEEVASFLLNEKRGEITKIELKQRVNVLMVPNKTMDTPHYKLERLKHDDARLESMEASYKLAEELDTETTVTRRSQEPTNKQTPMIKGVLPDMPAPIAEPRPEGARNRPANGQQRDAKPAAAPAPAPAAAPVVVREQGFFAWLKSLFGFGGAPAPVAAPVPAPETPAREARRDGRNDSRGRRNERGGDRTERNGERAGAPNAERQAGAGDRNRRNPERSERTERGERPERGERADRGERRGRGDRSRDGESRQPLEAVNAVAADGSSIEQRPERAPRGERQERGEGRRERGERGERAERGERSERQPRQFEVAPESEDNLDNQAQQQDPSLDNAAPASGEEQPRQRRSRDRYGRDRRERGDRGDRAERGPREAEGEAAQPLEAAAVPEQDQPARRSYFNAVSPAAEAQAPEAVVQAQVPAQPAEAIEAQQPAAASLPEQQTAAPEPSVPAPAVPAPVAAAAVAAAVPAPDDAKPAAAAAERGLPKVKAYDLPTSELQALAAASGLQWVGSDPDKVAAVQAAIAAEPQPERVVRERPPAIVLDDGPLILVETRKDLSDLQLPFEQQPQQGAAHV
jgi:ribonuclease E